MKNPTENHLNISLACTVMNHHDTKMTSSTSRGEGIDIVTVITKRQNHGFFFQDKLSEQRKWVYFRKIRFKRMKDLEFSWDLNNVHVLLKTIKSVNGTSEYQPIMTSGHLERTIRRLNLSSACLPVCLSVCLCVWESKDQRGVRIIASLFLLSFFPSLKFLLLLSSQRLQWSRKTRQKKRTLHEDLRVSYIQ